MVGARASTGYGEHVTMELTAGLVDQGVAIVSGAAYGIDGMAHRAALASGGTTIAVLAGGIDRLYPSGHDALLQRIIETGLVLTELPCGFAPTKWRFLQRNRLIAAASEATVVVEAGWRSGSLNTAHHALELDRPLGVVPGPITSASSAGCHRLLRETPAVCVTSAEEILSLTHSPAGDVGVVLREEPAAVHPFATRVLDAMSARKGRTIDELARLSGLSGAETLAVVGLLELSSLVREAPTGWVKQSA
jgi:DNA processing protein